MRGIILYDPSGAPLVHVNSSGITSVAGSELRKSNIVVLDCRIVTYRRSSVDTPDVYSFCCRRYRGLPPGISNGVALDEQIVQLPIG